ncbi:MAG: DNA primase, partial [Rhodoferax sp.]|nr:DNA primase [Rhodoferax sp.]
FARFVSESIPLSQFLVDAARDGCDLQTAEGRAHFASNAKPLWEAMPAGALKQQLLTEIAELVQLSNRELLDVWQHAAARGARKSANKPASERVTPAYRDQGAATPKTSQRPRSSSRQPAARADHAARILLSNMAAIETLTSEDQALLCGLGAPHGPLFVWLEAQHHEHGAQPWAVLRAGLQEHPSQAYALQLMSGQGLTEGAPDDAGDSSAEASNELRRLLNRMLIEQLKVDETAAIAAAKTDPAALPRYRELQSRRLTLEAAGQAPRSPAPA